MSLLEHPCWVESKEKPSDRAEFLDAIVARSADRLAATSENESLEPQEPKSLTAEERLQRMFRGTGVLVSPTQEAQTFVIPEQGPGLPPMRVPAQLAKVVSHQMRNELLARGPQ